MVRILRVMTLLAVLLAPPRLGAQEPLTLETALQAALAQNAGLRAARAASAEVAAHVTEARSGFFPRVSFAESWQRGDQPVFVFSSLLSARRFGAGNFAIDALNHPDPIGFFRTGVTVEQVMFDGGRRRSEAAAAGLRRDIATIAAEQASADVALAVAQVFGRIVAAQAARDAATGALAAAREDLSRAERRRDAGLATDADVLAIRVHVADLEQRAIQAGGDQAVAGAELNRLMGRPIDREVRAIEPASIAEAAGEPPGLEGLLAEADAARPETRRAEASLQLADTGRRAARASLIPQVAAQAVFDVSGTSFDDRASAWIVGAELRWSFSTGGAERARIKAAAEAAARARAERDEARAAVHVDVVGALRRLETARARQAAGRAAAEQARESQRITRNRFDAGVASATDVLRASAAVLEAEANRVSALVDAIVGRALLGRALGRAP